MSKISNSQWTDGAWLNQAYQWIHETLARQDISVSGTIEQPHVRLWSTILRVPTDRGVFFFKATTPSLAHETAVSQALYTWRPDCVLPVLAIDAKKGWMLMADGGRTVREVFGKALTLDSWKEILTVYAELQISLAEHVNDLLALGSRDRRLALLPGLYDWLLEEPEWLLIDQENGVSSAEYKRLIEVKPQVAGMCHRLADYNIPESLHHNDLHDGNIFYNNGRYLFFDWGDSSVAHPFFSLRTVFVSIENTFGVIEDAPIFEEIANAYLASWEGDETIEKLTIAFDLAKRLWSLSSAVKYKTFLSQLDEHNEEYAGAVPSLLKEFLETNA